METLEGFVEKDLNLCFNEDVYLGYVPGGRVEIVSLDPELGGIFYIFDVPRGPGLLRIERSERCMNCHAAADTGYVPGLVIKSVVPGPTGGSLTAYRQEQTGHGIPFELRFGGWYVTGQHNITNHWGNRTGRLTAGKLTRFPILPGERFRFERYPVATSDILPQLVLEHQAGFVNRVVEAAYRARTALHASNGQLTHLIYSSLFSSLPAEMKRRIYQRMREALSAEEPEKEFAYLPVSEKKTIREILKATLPDLPNGW